MNETHYVIAVEPGDWFSIFTVRGRMGRTTEPKNIAKYETPEDALEVLEEQRRWHPYPLAKIQKMTITIE